MNDWKEQGLCWDTDSRVFFIIRAECENERDYNDKVEKAQAICNRCPVRPECEAAGADMEYGIWGGVVK